MEIQIQRLTKQRELGDRRCEELLQEITRLKEALTRSKKECRALRSRLAASSLREQRLKIKTKAVSSALLLANHCVAEKDRLVAILLTNPSP